MSCQRAGCRQKLNDTSFRRARRRGRREKGMGLSHHILNHPILPLNCTLVSGGVLDGIFFFNISFMEKLLRMERTDNWNGQGMVKTGFCLAHFTGKGACFCEFLGIQRWMKYKQIPQFLRGGPWWRENRLARAPPQDPRLQWARRMWRMVLP